jgi:hypothetical protein
VPPAVVVLFAALVGLTSPDSFVAWRRKALPPRKRSQSTQVLDILETTVVLAATRVATYRETTATGEERLKHDICGFKSCAQDRTAATIVGIELLLKGFAGPQPTLFGVLNLLSSTLASGWCQVPQCGSISVRENKALQLTAPGSV